MILSQRLDGFDNYYKNRHLLQPLDIAQFRAATGGVYKGQGRNQCKLMTCVYLEFLLRNALKVYPLISKQEHDAHYIVARTNHIHELRTAMHHQPPNHERAINLFPVLSQIKPQAPLLVVPFHFRFREELGRYLIAFEPLTFDVSLRSKNFTSNVAIRMPPFVPINHEKDSETTLTFPIVLFHAEIFKHKLFDLPFPLPTSYLDLKIFNPNINNNTCRTLIPLDKADTHTSTIIWFNQINAPRMWLMKRVLAQELPQLSN
uniref:Transcriptional regulator n=1 Tax=Parastrongyloides trichosuri TaxID=131310 RepID=A0A0N4Z1D1_PARTI